MYDFSPVLRLGSTILTTFERSEVLHFTKNTTVNHAAFINNYTDGLREGVHVWTARISRAIDDAYDQALVNQNEKAIKIQQGDNGLPPLYGYEIGYQIRQ